MLKAYDLIILGGGCAGLSLAQKLANRSFSGLRTLVLEQRSEYINDRTWCFWKTDQNSYFAPVDCEWNTMRLCNSSPGQAESMTVNCADMPYQMLSSARFYAAALAQIRLASHIDLKLSTSIDREPVKVANNWLISSADSQFSAPMVIDTRPFQVPRRGDVDLWQSFYGYEVKCEQPVFDASCLDLMDFLPTASQAIPFVYVLPTSPYQALIEITVFSPTPLSPTNLQVQLDDAVLNRLGKASFSQIRTEHGILPMGLNIRAHKKDDSYVHVGVMSGAARSSTGFAFQRIQLWARQCAESLRQKGKPIGHIPDHLVLRAMDALFLKVLLNNPEKAAILFCTLFKKARTASVIRFLSGHGGFWDCLSVVRALPATLFLRTIFSRKKVAIPKGLP